MNPLRLAVRFRVTEPAVDLSVAIETFHRFIQQGLVQGLVLDVADYRHVPQGPGVVLIGHDVDYALDDVGFTATRKRARQDDVMTQFRDALRMGLVAVAAIEDDPALTVGIDRTTFTVAAFDRAAGTRDEIEAELLSAVESVATELFGPETTAESVEARDPRHAPEVLVRSPGFAADDVIAVLGGAEIPGQSPWDISVDDLVRLRESNEEFTLVDVREDSEYEQVNLDGRLIPLGDLASRLDELDRDGKVVVHCRSGIRGADAVATLRDAGFADAWNVRGALVAWRERIDSSVTLY